MAYIALYRKYRPERFSDVVGQEHVKRTLINAIKKDQLSHAYLFSGPRGTGKTTVARILARAANCLDLHDGEPCGKCDNCKSISNGVWGIVEIDGASHNSVEDIRELQDVIHHVPMKGKYTVYIIDEVHMLSRPAFNAFLKTLEEPPPHAKFILATTEPYKLPKTILSRCQHFLFTNISLEEISKQVQKLCKSEKVKISQEAADFLALHGRGSMRDTISLLDQAVIYSGDEISLDTVKDLLGVTEESVISELVDSMLEHDTGKLMQTIDSIIITGQDLAEISSAIISHLRNLMLIKAGIKNERILGFIGKQLPKLESQSEKVTETALLKILEYLGEASHKMKFEIDQRLGLETALLTCLNMLAAPSQSPVALKEKEVSETQKPPVKTDTSQTQSSFPQRHEKPSAQGKKSDLDILKPAGSKPKPETPVERPPQTEKKNPATDFPGFWKQFLSYLKSEDLPLLIFVRGTEQKFDGTSLSLFYHSSEKFRHQFAIQDDVGQRLAAKLSTFSGLDLFVTIDLMSEMNEINNEVDPLLNSEWKPEIQKSEKVNWEKIITESFMEEFPKGQLKWEDQKNSDTPH